MFKAAVIAWMAVVGTAPAHSPREEAEARRLQVIAPDDGNEAQELEDYHECRAAGCSDHECGLVSAGACSKCQQAKCLLSCNRGKGWSGGCEYFDNPEKQDKCMREQRQCASKCGCHI